MKLDRKLIYDKCNGHCGYCGIRIEIKQMQVDHIIPQKNFEWHIRNGHFKTPNFLKHLGLGDINNIDNLMPSCRSCNNFKHTFDLETFREELQIQVERLNKYSVNFRMARKFGLIRETGAKVKFYFENNNP